MKHLKYIWVFFIFLGSAQAQYLAGARTLAMAGSNIAIAEGSEYIGGNPATLALRQKFNFELQLLSAHLMIKNNSFSLKEYDRYFTTGDSLTAQDIEDLLGNIPEGGMQADFQFGVKTFAIYARPFSISITGMGNGFVNFPKSPFQIPFYGNTKIKEYSFDDLDGEGWGAAGINFGLAFPITKYFMDEFQFVSVGISPKYLIGMQYAKIVSGTGELLTTDQDIIADGDVLLKRSTGGAGFGVDIGALAKYKNFWTFSFSISNLLGSMNWNKESQQVHFRYSGVLNFNNIKNFETIETRDTTDIGSFRTGLPRTITAAAAFQYRRNVVFTAAWRQGMDHALGNYTRPRISVGTEYRPISVLPLRSGMAFGGANGFSLGLGLGIDLNYWQLNLGYLNQNFRWFRGAKSAEVALTTQFRF